MTALNEKAGMRRYNVAIGSRAAPRLRFTALASDAMAATIDHMDKAEVGEAVRVTPMERVLEATAKAWRVA